MAQRTAFADDAAPMPVQAFTPSSINKSIPQEPLQRSAYRRTCKAPGLMTFVGVPLM